MPTSVHLPKPLLAALDRRARRLNVSRNRVIVSVLEASLAADEDWSPGFLEKLGHVEPGDAAAVDAMLAAIRTRRSSKAPRKL